MPCLQRTTVNKFNCAIDEHLKHTVKQALNNCGIKFKPNAMTCQWCAQSSSSSEGKWDKKKAGKKHMPLGQHYSMFVAFQHYFNVYVMAGYYGSAIEDKAVHAQFHMMLWELIHENIMNSKVVGDNWHGIAEVLDRQLYRISKWLQNKHSVES